MDHLNLVRTPSALSRAPLQTVGAFALLAAAAHLGLAGVLGLAIGASATHYSEASRWLSAVDVAVALLAGGTGLFLLVQPFGPRRWLGLAALALSEAGGVVVLTRHLDDRTAGGLYVSPGRIAACFGLVAILYALVIFPQSQARGRLRTGSARRRQRGRRVNPAAADVPRDPTHRARGLR